jgi:pimeloyl-ACP methyl ester carboxylesterase
MTPIVGPEAAAPAWFSAALASPAQVRATTSNGTTIAYRAWGEPGGRGIVLVHGGAAHSRWWDHIAPLLSNGWRVAAVDLSGHGDSGRRDSYDLDTWARELLAVADDAGITAPPVLVGHSLGGLISLRAASMFGGRLEGIVVIDSPVRDSPPEDVAAREKRAFGELRVYASREELVARFHPIPDQPVLPYVAEHVAATSVRQVPGGWTWKFDPRIFGRHDTHQLLMRLDCRVALLRAEHGMISVAAGEIMYDRLGRSAPVIEIPASGHHIMLDQPIALVAALRTLLSDWDHSSPAIPPLQP